MTEEIYLKCSYCSTLYYSIFKESPGRKHQKGDICEICRKGILLGYVPPFEI